MILVRNVEYTNLNNLMGSKNDFTNYEISFYNKVTNCNYRLARKRKKKLTNEGTGICCMHCPDYLISITFYYY